MKSLQYESTEDDRFGLKWEEGLFCPIPAWTATPDTAVITQVCTNFAAEHLAPQRLVDIEVNEIAQGAFNRVYSAKVKSRSDLISQEQAETGCISSTKEYLYICRVSLPINPYYKTMSEYATLAYVRKNTSIPVARVLSLNPFNHENNSLRFEWMLQTYMPGRSLDSIWHRMDDLGRQHVVRQLAKFQVEVFNMQHESIGSLYTELETEAAHRTFKIDRIVTMPFCMRDRVQINGVHRGPFKSSREWLRAQLHVIQLECENHLEKIAPSKSGKLEENDVCERVLQTSISVVQRDHVVEHSHVKDWKIADEGPSGNNEVDNAEDAEDDEDDEDDSEEQDEDSLQARSELIKRLTHLLPRAIPQTSDRSMERSVLSHPDLSLRNILVDEENIITAVLDWENSACLPTWAACDVPSLLEGQSLHSLPNPEDYNRGEQDSLYTEQSNWYQLTRLRETFLSYMKEKCPSWTEIYENSRVQRDFRRAVELCDYDPARRSINHWLTIFEKNNFSVDRNQYIPLDL